MATATAKATGVPRYQGKKQPLMPIEGIADWEKRIARQDAFWRCEITDRPVVVMNSWQDDPAFPSPATSHYKAQRDRWLDPAYHVKVAERDAACRRCYGDALPTAFPNLGPELFSAFFGTPMDYGETTSWTVANLHDWSQADAVRFSADNFYWKRINEVTDALLAAGKGRFYVGYTDLHPGGDAIAAFRDPVNLNMDMLLAVDDVKRLLSRVDDVFIDVFNYFVDKLQAYGQAVTSWPGIVSSRRWHVPSNDFSCMISKEMFDDVFLAGIARECRNAEASIYHLDGPNALKHLDSLLAIKELNAIQWVYGDGHGRPTDWLHVYQKCQKAGKGVQIGIDVKELDVIMQNLRPEGVWLNLWVKDEQEAGEVLRRVGKWR